MSLASALNTLPGEPGPHRWTVDRLYRAIDADVFERPERLELIRGELIEKMGQNPAHASIIDILVRRLRERAEPRFTVREQKPLQIAADAESVPDIMIVTGVAGDYISRHPSPADVMLLFEVADSSWIYDTQAKAMLYAQSGIVEYWVALAAKKEIIVHRKPAFDGYALVDRFAGRDLLSPLSAPDIAFTVQELFEL